MKLPFLLFDIGGTKTRIAISESGKNFNDPVIFKTPKNFEVGIEEFVKVVKGLGIRPGSVAGGIAGPLSSNKSGIVNTTNLTGWNGKDLKGELQSVFKTTVFLENDTAMVGLGEAVEGPGKDFEISVYITISTGVNGVRIVNKEIDENEMGFEMGEQIIDDGNTLEQLISGTAIEKKYKKHPKEVKDPKVWDGVSKDLAIGIHNTIDFWSPDIIILGGSMMRDIPIKSINKYLGVIPTKFPRLPKIVKSELGDLGGLWGSLYYLNSLG